MIEMESDGIRRKFSSRQQVFCKLVSSQDCDQRNNNRCSHPDNSINSMNSITNIWNNTNYEEPQSIPSSSYTSKSFKGSIFTSVRQFLLDLSTISFQTCVNILKRLFQSTLIQKISTILLYLTIQYTILSYDSQSNRLSLLSMPLTRIRPLDYKSNRDWQSVSRSYDIMYRIVKSECAELCLRKDLSPYSIKFGQMRRGDCGNIGYSIFNRLEDIKFGPFGLMKVRVFRSKE